MPVKIITRSAIEKIDRIETKVVFLSNFENKTGTKRPVTAIVNVNELTYKPDIAIEVLKYSDICEIIPIILKGVFIPNVDNIKIYKSIFGLFFIIFFLHSITIVM